MHLTEGEIMHDVKESINKVENEFMFQQFCTSRQLEKSTILTYKYALQKYCDFTGKSLEALIREADDQQDAGVKYRYRNIYKYLIDFQSYLDSLNIPQSSQSNYLVRIRAFYGEYDIQLPKTRKNKSKKARGMETIEVLPEMDEIRRFMEYCNNAYKAILVMGLSSGMGRAEISSLTFKDLFEAVSLERYPMDIPEIIENVKQKGNLVPKWNIRRVKTGHLYFTFSSPESIERILIYLEELHYKFPNFKPTPEDRLFRGLNSNKPLKPSNIGGMFSNMNTRKGFRKVNNLYVLRSHGFRKKFASTLEKNKVPHLITRKLMGHTVDGTTGAYFMTDPEDAKEEYLRVVDQLMTTKQGVMVINNQETLRQEFDNLKGLIIERGMLPPEYKDHILKEELKKQSEFDKQFGSQKQGLR